MIVQLLILEGYINSDDIVRGNVIEKGRHVDLMVKHGFYYDLYTSQFR